MRWTAGKLCLPSLLHQIGCVMYRSQNAPVRAAATQVRFERSPNIGFGGPRILQKKRLRAHHHPWNAVAALSGLFCNESLLHRARLIRRTESLDSRDLTPFEQAHGYDAR